MRNSSLLFFIKLRLTVITMLNEISSQLATYPNWRVSLLFLWSSSCWSLFSACLHLLAMACLLKIPRVLFHQGGPYFRTERFDWLLSRILWRYSRRHLRQGWVRRFASIKHSKSASNYNFCILDTAVTWKPQYLFKLSRIFVNSIDDDVTASRAS